MEDITYHIRCVSNYTAVINGHLYGLLGSIQLPQSYVRRVSVKRLINYGYNVANAEIEI